MCGAADTLFIHFCLHKLQLSKNWGTETVSLPRHSVGAPGRGGEDTYAATKSGERISTSSGTNESRERRAAACTLLIGLTTEVDTPGQPDKGGHSMPRRLSRGEHVAGQDVGQEQGKIASLHEKAQIS